MAGVPLSILPGVAGELMQVGGAATQAGVARSIPLLAAIGA